MSAPFVTLPSEGWIHLARARVPSALLHAELNPAPPPDADGLVQVDLHVDAGRISHIAPGSEVAPENAVDLAGSQVWPCFVDCHTHLDKGHIEPRARNTDGTLDGAVRATRADREAFWQAGDVRRRFEFGLRCAHAHGTSAIRTHLDCDSPQDQISWPVFAELREAWAGRIDLQAVAKVPVEAYLTPQGEQLAQLAARHGGILGGVTRIFHAPAEKSAVVLDLALDALFALAARLDLEVDLHVDETGDPRANTLAQVARAVLRHRFPNRVLCGHCCSLAVQSEDVVRQTLELCAEARLGVVLLPLINPYLQDRQAGRTPRWRGITLIHELAARGVPVAVASDNCRDPFFAFGDHDMLEVFRQAVRLAHLDFPIAPWPQAACSIPAALMGQRDKERIAAGHPADLVIFRARTMSELLSRPQADRLVLRRGRAIDTTLPDYRELDDLFNHDSL
jgi:cytosine deaminase